MQRFVGAAFKVQGVWGAQLTKVHGVQRCSLSRCGESRGQRPLGIFGDLGGSALDSCGELSGTLSTVTLKLHAGPVYIYSWGRINIYIYI